MELSELKGVGIKTQEAMNKAGIMDVNDLLLFFPRNYEIFNEPGFISEIGYKPFAVIKGAFVQEPGQRVSGKLTITQAVFYDDAGNSIRAVWFNAPFIRTSIKPGIPYVLRGRISRKYGSRQIDQPKVYTLAEYDRLQGKMQPVYPAVKGISNMTVSKAVSRALESGAAALLDAMDFVPSRVAAECGLCPRSMAVRSIHFPENAALYADGIRRMAFEEIFLFIYSMRINSSSKTANEGICISESENISSFINHLPYSLTQSQLKVLKEIADDMSSGKLMNRLIQGDVGSGKTVVALISLMNAAYAGYQGAFMAPTEVLAMQHYKKISGLFEENGINLKTAVLTGSMTASEKKGVYKRLEEGDIDILVGTHALIQEKVRFCNLGLVVTDEQHRFGTNQRKELAAKAGGVQPHVLVMSATPIPRTLALILYGDMDVSVIDKSPSKRLPIKNAVVDESYHENAYRFIANQVKLGHQAYIICPLVEYSEGLDRANVEDYSQMLEEVLPAYIRIGKLTGPMSPAKKNEVMKKFADGEIDVLVSTTVVEVGVDVPNATVMMVEDADRFGLAALHQLRGRVGRGDAQSYCIFFSNSKSSQAAERLEILKTSNDGFEIAAKDLELRGPGELTGIRQSGILSFACFDIERDADIAVMARDAAERIIRGEMLIGDDEKRSLDEKCRAGQGSIML